MWRRTLLLMLVMMACLAAVLYQRGRPLPDPAAQGSGREIELAIFTNDGRQTGTMHVRKIVKTEAEWHDELSSAEFAVTRRKGTEPAYAGRYWNLHETGMYRCVCCGNALFRSVEKFDSGTGWPSFTAPAAGQNVRTRPDHSLGVERTEVLCAKCDAHLGHVFPDGPPPNSLRFCPNSAALRFVPAPDSGGR